MKKYFMIVTLGILAVTSGCKKQHAHPKVPPPAWQADSSGKYPASMTAVVVMPQPMQSDVQESDLLGAFIGGKCRGTGSIVTVGEQKEFFILIHGTASEQSMISFKYYSARHSAVYQTDAFLPFVVDGNYGTADGPEILNLQRVK